MNVLIEGCLEMCSDGYICASEEIADKEFKIDIRPDITTITFPRGFLFSNPVEFQKQLYHWIGQEPADYRIYEEGDTTVLEIDLPPPDCKFRLEMGEERYCWTGYETNNTRYLKRYPILP
mgnify:CR=1 FL=1|jgi:hypothetical protein